MYAETLLRTALVALSLFGLPLLALIWSWRREQAPIAGEESAPRPAWSGAPSRHRLWHL